ncbi:ATP-dependent helicase HrpB [Cytophagales bacterium LB-30]|uniref:ATP-dependent helicase HrpB n=1 Tax=Shiella aurantiaca TaxID=3058365 RepID=A0ABT8F0F0_9BACT|nr:ATP-dependent helicase HrpB [Shiella aurantiaca]MDN4163921.1 ATP-dependent helicase HrpB [Shiella aurantiaca]
MKLASFGLPVEEIVPELHQHLAQSNTLLLGAPPGAGKSTFLPLELLKSPWLEGKKIIMLEPRRLAARSVAMRMADMLGESIGETVGYTIRFERVIGPKTRIEVVTEGILTRMLHSDNSLEEAGLVIFDEFHERSIHADVALALAREAQQVLRPDLRILLMSATLNMPELAQLLQAPVLQSEGKQYPVEVKYLGESDASLISELTARAIVKASKEQGGDILAFLPGQGEILRCEEMLKKELRDFSIHPLFGQLPQAKQYAAIMPNRSGKRKVVLATSIAETSLTIEGITVVVDSGLGRTQRFDPKSGLSRLETIQISKDSADQRAGRAGRLSPGTCYRLWSKATHERLAENRIPEIMEADLCSLMLDLAQWGISDIRQLTWLNTPPAHAVKQASETIQELGALENGKITPHGKELHELPCHPRIAHMLLMAEKEGMLGLACDIAALLEERDPLNAESGIDINTRIEMLRRVRRDNSQHRNFWRIDKVAASYRKMFQAEVENEAYDPYQTGILLAYAFPERIAFARPGNNAQFQLANGKYAFASHKDDLAHEPWLAIAHLDARDGLGKIFMAAPLNPRDLAPLVKEKEVLTWDTRKGGVVATRDLRIGSIVLQSKPLAQVDQSKLIEAICEAIKKEGERLLPWTEEVTQWQNRVMSLRKWRPQEAWPEVSTVHLLQTNAEWLSPYLTQVKKPEDLQKIDLQEVLQSHLSYELQQELLRLAPTHLEVPSGSKIPLIYQPDGSAPVLAVRLQELFGLAESPSVNEGKIKVLLHLLSPGYKPVQVTSDLKSFWNNTYFEVKKDLKRRYPKHSWPEDPWTADAVRGVKKKGV